jgi:hypothetical protein
MYPYSLSWTHAEYIILISSRFTFIFLTLIFFLMSYNSIKLVFMSLDGIL